MTHETDPTKPFIKPNDADPTKVEVLFGTDEVFEAVKNIDGFPLYEGLTLAVGRRSGPNSDKGFSTDSEKSKIYCPGKDDQQHRTADQILGTVLRSSLTLVRHGLNPDLGATKAKKSDKYKEEQAELAQAVLVVAQQFRFEADTEAEFDQTAYAELQEMFNRFMKVSDENETANASSTDALNGVIHMILMLQDMLGQKA